MKVIDASTGKEVIIQSKMTPEWEKVLSTVPYDRENKMFKGEREEQVLAECKQARGW